MSFNQDDDDDDDDQLFEWYMHRLEQTSFGEKLFPNFFFILNLMYEWSYMNKFWVFFKNINFQAAGLLFLSDTVKISDGSGSKFLTRVG